MYLPLLISQHMSCCVFLYVDHISRLLVLDFDFTPE